MSLPPEGFPLGYSWDEDKNRSNVRDHGIDFRDAVRIFQGPTLDFADTRHGYGEERTVSFGDLDGRKIAAVVHTDRDGTTRLISARNATSREQGAYRDYVLELSGEKPDRRRGREIDFDF